jgi:3-phosphoshikimate 1-carboxyvinyltransferase
MPQIVSICVHLCASVAKMALPDPIEIIPLTVPVRAAITVPGSKSITNRALILAALAEGEVTLKGALWSEDTQIMVECLQELGFMVNVEPDPNETCNRTITIYGNGGAVPPGGTEAQPLDLFVGNAGTAARFLAAFVCLGKGAHRLSGVPRMHERPQAALFAALRELGYRVESENGNDKLPVKIWGKAETGNRKAETSCKVSVAESSQFASALLLSAKAGGWKIEVVGENAEESPYIAMTAKLMETFPKSGGTFQIEPDASSGSYFVATSELLGGRDARPITVAGWPVSNWQVDANFLIALPLPPVLSRGGQPDDGLIHLGDSIMTAIVIAPFHDQPVKFTGLGRLRVQECERVVALRTELTKCGARVIEEGDTLTVWPSQLHGAEIETYNDHRMAMCFAVLGLKVPGIKIKNPACVKKTFPNFFQKLAAPPPHGLGAEIWEIKNGRRTRKLSGEDLFAD